MLKGIHQVINKDKNSDWSIQKGPAPGIKYRGGQPPAPPPWNYAQSDLTAFQKWERKPSIWRIQVASYLPPSDAAMLLYASLRGDLKEELEWADVSKINSDSGIDFIVESLRKPMETRDVYIKRRYLYDYENIYRQQGETIKTFINRYRRSERQLQAVNIDVTAMYDSEARGTRMLDRLRLAADQQRLILVGSLQSLHFEAIRDSACLQFPEHRPTPFVVTSREFDAGPQPKQFPPRDGQQQAQQNSLKPYYSHNKGKSKGKGFVKSSNPPAKTAFLAGIPEGDGEPQEELEAATEPDVEEF